MLSIRQIRLLVSVLRPRPRAEVIRFAESIGLDEADVEDLTASRRLDLRHDAAGAPYIAAGEKGRGELLALLGGAAVGAATIANVIIAAAGS